MTSEDSSQSVENVRAQLQAHFKEYSGSKAGEGWSELWNRGDSLPWDRGFPNPALVDTLKEKQDIIGNAVVHDQEDGRFRRKRALVPGCGRGYDVLLLRSFGYDALGLEYSEAAVKACHRFQAEHEAEYPTQDERIGDGSASFVVGDFFKNNWRPTELGADVRFDLIYDYTFFCALEPPLRPAWAHRMYQLLKPRPKGNLVCVEFPTYKPPSAGGPPFSSPSEAYSVHLSHPGGVVEYGKEGLIDTFPLEIEPKQGLIQVAHWKAARSHQISVDEEGNVRDWVGVWQHH